MSLARLSSFVLLTIIGGLLQLWVVCILIAMKGDLVLDFTKILSDGSLFFFSTSMVYSSWFSLSSTRQQHTTQTPSFVMTIFSVGLVTVLSLVAYSISAYENIRGSDSPPFPANNYLFAQIVCAIISVIYTFYVCAVTGLFAAEHIPSGQKEITEHV
jgi:hypothetical protein